jgi:hypothetical protein
MESGLGMKERIGTDVAYANSPRWFSTFCKASLSLDLSNRNIVTTSLERNQDEELTVYYLLEIQLYIYKLPE